MTGIVTIETAHRIWLAHREIEIGTKMLADMQETIERDEKETPIDRSHQKHLQLGVPSFTGHRLLDVAPALAITIIEAHIANKRRELIEASAVAAQEAM